MTSVHSIRRHSEPPKHLKTVVSDLGLFQSNAHLSNPYSFVATLAGCGRRGFINGSLEKSQFNSPSSILVLGNSEIILADSNNQCLRKINKFSKQTQTICNNAWMNPTGLVELCGRLLFVCDSGHHRIKIAKLGLSDPWEGAPVQLQWIFDLFASKSPNDDVITLAGNGQRGFRDGPAEKASFNNPSGVCFSNNGTILIVDQGNNAIRELSPKVGRKGFHVSTIVTSEGLNGITLCLPRTIKPSVVDKNTYFIADTKNHAIRMLKWNNKKDCWVLTHVAGGVPGFADGTSVGAMMYLPNDIAPLPSGDIMVADTGNHRIRMISKDEQGRYSRVTTIAGRNAIPPKEIMKEYQIDEDTFEYLPFSPKKKTIVKGKEGTFRAALLPSTMAEEGISAKSLKNKFMLQKAASNAAEEKKMIPLPSSNSKSGYADGFVHLSEFKSPMGIAFCPQDGTIIVTDSGNSLIRVIVPKGFEKDSDVNTLFDAKGLKESMGKVASSSTMVVDRGVNSQFECMLEESGINLMKSLQRKVNARLHMKKEQAQKAKEAARIIKPPVDAKEVSPQAKLLFAAKNELKDHARSQFFDQLSMTQTERQSMIKGSSDLAEHGDLSETYYISDLQKITKEKFKSDFSELNCEFNKYPNVNLAKSLLKSMCSHKIKTAEDVDETTLTKNEVMAKRLGMTVGIDLEGRTVFLSTGKECSTTANFANGLMTDKQRVSNAIIKQHHPTFKGQKRESSSLSLSSCVPPLNTSSSLPSTPPPSPTLIPVNFSRMKKTTKSLEPEYLSGLFGDLFKNAPPSMLDATSKPFVKPDAPSAIDSSLLNHPSQLPTSQFTKQLLSSTPTRRHVPPIRSQVSANLPKPKPTPLPTRTPLRSFQLPHTPTTTTSFEFQLPRYDSPKPGKQLRSSQLRASIVPKSPPPTLHSSAQTKLSTKQPTIAKKSMDSKKKAELEGVLFEATSRLSELLDRLEKRAQ